MILSLKATSFILFVCNSLSIASLHLDTHTNFCYPLSVVFQHYVSYSKSYSTLQVCNLLMSFAKLNFQLGRREEFYQKVTNQSGNILLLSLSNCNALYVYVCMYVIGFIVWLQVHKALEGSFQNLEPFLKTDVVWSLCVLKQANADYISSVMKHDFQKKLSGAEEFMC